MIIVPVTLVILSSNILISWWMQVLDSGSISWECPGLNLYYLIAESTESILLPHRVGVG